MTSAATQNKLPNLLPKSAWPCFCLDLWLPPSPLTLFYLHRHPFVCWYYCVKNLLFAKLIFIFSIFLLKYHFIIECFLISFNPQPHPGFYLVKHFSDTHLCFIFGGVVPSLEAIPVKIEKQFCSLLNACFMPWIDYSILHMVSISETVIWKIAASGKRKNGIGGEWSMTETKTTLLNVSWKNNWNIVKCWIWQIWWLIQAWNTYFMYFAKC